MNNEERKSVEDAIEKGNLEEALDILNSQEDETIEMLLVRGKLLRRMQKLPEAMNDYIMVLDMDEDNQEAIVSLKMLREIMGFGNMEQFNV